jgi:hypothetical protein
MVLRLHPQLVVFHSLTYLSDWSHVIGTTLRQITRQMYLASTSVTSFCLIPNANSRGMSYERLYEYAALVKPQINLRTQ